MRDLRFACRLLLRSPLPSLVVVCSLALGIGGAASVFTLLNAVVLRALPVTRPAELYLAERHTAAGTSPRFSWPQVLDSRAELGSRAAIGAMTDPSGMQVRAAGDAAGDRAMVQLVSGEYFAVLGERAQLGRLLFQRR